MRMLFKACLPWEGFEREKQCIKHDAPGKQNVGRHTAVTGKEPEVPQSSVARAKNKALDEYCKKQFRAQHHLHKFQMHTFKKYTIGGLPG